MSNTTPEFNTEQLTAARAATWHQDGKSIVTLEDMRPFVYEHGLMLFAPRTQQIAVPAPSLVEATLGEANGEPTLAQTSVARSLVSRLVGEGNALPLNLFGEPGDAPDFVVSAQVFSFVYTLRGEKNWKQVPATSGTSKTTPLAVRIYEILGEKGGLTASELATELGRELTENAVQRALGELWTNLRVIPLYDQGDGATIWELTTRRFTKAIKAGINAGQPTALSALISLYLGQALLATDEEIEIFLSPLAARSRTREVINALRTARQLDTVVLEGKSLLFVPGTLPQFPELEVPVVEGAEGEEGAEPASTLEGEGRIKKFQSNSEERPKREYKGKPAFGAAPRKPAYDRKPAAGSKPGFAARPDRERRPFNRSGDDAKPSFTRPWDEDKKPRAPRRDSEGGASKPAFSRDRAPREGGFKKFDAPKRPYVRRDDAGAGDRPARPSFGAKKSFGDRPARSFDGPKRPYTPRGEGAGDRPSFSRDRAPREGGFKKFDAPKRPYVRRDDAGAGDRPARPSFGAKKSFGDKPGRSFDGPKRPYTPRGEGAGDRPARPSFGAKKSFGDRPARSFDGPKRPYTPRGEGAGDRPARPSFGAKKSFGDRPARSFDGPKRPYTPRGEGAGDRPARPSFGAKKSFGDRPARSFDGPKRPYTPRGEGAGDRPSRPSFGAKPGGFKKAGFSKPSFDRKPSGFSKPAGDSFASETRAPRAPRPTRTGEPGNPKVSFPRKRRSEEE